MVGGGGEGGGGGGVFIKYGGYEPSANHAVKVTWQTTRVTTVVKHFQFCIVDGIHPSNNGILKNHPV